MKRAIRLCAMVCALAASAAAAPKHRRASKLDPALSEHVKAAEQAWTAAENETSAVLQPQAWETAAKAFASVDGDAVDAKVKAEAARAAVLAWVNEIEVDVKVKSPSPHGADTSLRDAKPLPVPEREQAMIAAFDRFQAYVTDPTDVDLPMVRFLEAEVELRFNQFEPAIKLFRAILRDHRQHEVALYAANLLLDAYNRLGRYDDLIALANEIANDKAFLAGHDDLIDTIKKIQRVGGRQKAESLERAANDTHDPVTYVSAGHAYLDLYNADPKSSDGDELLYNAGVAFEEGHEIGVSLQMYVILAKSFPNSRIRPRAIARTARIYGDMAMYDKAAEKLEEYAKTYVGEKDAYDALSDAIYYRKALGDRDKAIADVNLYIKMFGARRPADAAMAKWSLVSLLEPDPASQLVHLREYVKMFGSKGGSERLVMAYAKIGQVLWKQSCPVAGFDGLCIESKENAPRTCGKGAIRTFKAVTRNAGKMKEALASFATAVREFERSHSEDVTARYYYAQAQLAAADSELEPYLALAFPVLDFGGNSSDPKAKQLHEASMKAFNGWFAAKTKGGESATRRYEQVLAIKDTASAITASERVALVSQSFASTMMTAKPPADLKRSPFPKDFLDAYCDAMVTAAEPLAERSIQALGVCLQKSTELAWFDDSSRVCEHELTRLRPEDFPAAKERRIEPILATPVIALEPATVY